jgi:hypothetical protein
MVNKIKVGDLVSYAWFNGRAWCSMAGTVKAVTTRRVLVELPGGDRWLGLDEVEAY